MSFPNTSPDFPLPPACAALEPLLADYAAQDLPPAETARVRAHLPGCPACRAHLAQYQQLLPLLSDVAPELPPLALRDEFLAMLAVEKQHLRPVAEPLPVPPVVRQLRPETAVSSLGWLRVAASVALLLLGAALGWPARAGPPARNWPPGPVSRPSSWPGS